MMYEAVRGAFAVDDAAESQGTEPRFKVRDLSLSETQSGW
jgi:hypothetical protein